MTPPHLRARFQIVAAIFLCALLCHAPTTQAAPNALDQAVLARLDKPITIETGETTLKQALDAIAEQAGVKITVDWPALEIVGVAPKAQVWINLNKVAADQVLQVALDHASADAFDDDRAGFTIQDGAVIVSTRRALKKTTEVESYDLKRYTAKVRGGEAKQELVDQFVELINMTVGDPDEWLDEESTLTEKNGKLVVKTTAKNHAQIIDLFAQLRDPIGKAGDVDTKADDAARAKLNKKLSYKQDNAALSDALKFIRESTGANLAVNWPGLELVGIEPNALFNINMKRVPAEELLQAILEQVSAEAFDDDKAGFVIHEGVVHIATLRELKGHTQMQVYNAARWLGKRAPNADTMQQLIEAIQDNVGDPDEWLDEEATITDLHGLLIIKASPHNHREILKLLGKMRQ